ncbi:ABC transporter substrate-binding protein [Amycolatopsis rubida]|uniref:ABC transporter substrate-binding protein n=1 Tax=Amycolatopsis rubida TaxID=112413 RepID=A0ABX0BHI1_9PSEU|nr:ABC transporter substrate-binding protein [Amycolatopsis sp. M39]NEC54802.1 ABC transporter substrate-binding protein [Amycolatopsis rubida]OAP23190.1 putative aliphatic sulfonates-binding protein precursor [Amycolatopsis sp. M39]
MHLRNILAAALLLTGLAACSSSASDGRAPVPAAVSPAELKKVTLRVGDQKGGVKSLLTAANQLNGAPYRIEWSTFTSGPPLLEAASAGAIDVGRVGNTPPIFAAASKAKISVVSVAKSNVERETILVPPDSPLPDVASLRGKTVGVAKGSSAHGQLLNTLKKAGLSTKDIKISFLQPSEAFAAFTQHQIDAWAIWDPYTAQAQIDAHARVLADGRGASNGLAFETASTTALADPGKNSAIRDFVQRVVKAQLWSNSHTDEWARAWAAETGLKPEVAKKAVSAGRDRPIPLDDAVVASEQQLSDAFANEGTLPGKVDFAAFVDRRYGPDIEAARRNG